jgi:hypothetical protein
MNLVAYTYLKIWVVESIYHMNDPPFTKGDNATTGNTDKSLADVGHDK